MRRWFLLLAFLLSAAALAQDSAELDGPKHQFQDPFLENLVGSWKLTGKVMGTGAEHEVDAEWVLNHQFLRIHEKDENLPKDGNVPYEATIMVGYDNASERYVAHWLDIYGGRFSETLGYGTRTNNEVRFVFEYPDGPFHTTFRWLPDNKQWQWLMETKTKSGQWKQFADLTLTQKQKP